MNFDKFKKFFFSFFPFLLFQISSDLKLFYTFTINYGFQEDEIGIIVEPETPPLGPLSFSADGNGNIYIADPVNSSIKVFSMQGKLLKIVSFKGFYDDLIVTPEGEIYILKRDSSEVLRIEADGRIISFRISPEISLHPSKLFLWKGNVFVKDERLLALLYSKDSSREIPYFYDVEFLKIGKGIIRRISPEGEKREFFIERESLLSLEFLNEDKNGNIYLQIEYLISDNMVGLEVVKVNQKGDIVSVIPIPENDYFLWTSRLLFVDEKGWIYQVLPGPTSVKVNVWKD